MATISSAGIGSGLDVNSLISKLMDLERQPIRALDAKEAKIQAKVSALGLLKSSLSTLQTAARALSTPAQLSPLRASVADSTILGASASSSATPGTYDIEVQSLAESQKLLTGGYANTSDAIGTVGKTITFTFGTYAAGPTFTANPDKTAQTITIDSDNNSLAGLRDAINAANIGVTASIINDGSANGYHLSLASTDTGASNAMKVSVDDASLDAFTYDPTGGTSSMTQTVAAQDAVIKVDTTTITKSSNTITDAIEGVTLNLTKESASGVTTRLTLARDNSSIQSAIQNLVKAYNDTSKALADASAYDVATGKAATLNGDTTVRMIQSQLRSLMSAPISGAASGAATLIDIGITFQRDGSLAIDATTLSAALADPTKDFTALFAYRGTNKGYGAQLDTVIGQINSPIGIIATHTKGLNSSITDIGKQRNVLESRLVNVESRYRAQFTALDRIVSSMNTTSTYLAQQLTAISAMTNGINSGQQ